MQLRGLKWFERPYNLIQVMLAKGVKMKIIYFYLFLGVLFINPIMTANADQNGVRFLYEFFHERELIPSSLCQIKDVQFSPKSLAGRDSHENEVSFSVVKKLNYGLSSPIQFSVDIEANDPNFLKISETNGKITEITYTWDWGFDNGYKNECYLFLTRTAENKWELKLTRKEWIKGTPDSSLEQLSCKFN